MRCHGHLCGRVRLTDLENYKVSLAANLRLCWVDGETMYFRWNKLFYQLCLYTIMQCLAGVAFRPSLPDVFNNPVPLELTCRNKL